MLQFKLLAADYQILSVSAFPPDQPIKAEELASLQLPQELNSEREVILFGQMPIWVYGALIDRLQNAAWIGCFAALEKGAVVVHSRVPERTVGEVVPIRSSRPPCPAILIGGAPDSGKSVLSNALRLSLIRQHAGVQVFLHRANWDGEGNWSHETQNGELAKRLIREHERRLHEHPHKAELLLAYFTYHTQAIAHLRGLVDLVIVDIGGKIQIEKQGLLQQCTHYIIISSAPDAVQPWHDFCQPYLKPIAVVHSSKQPCLQVDSTEPFLEITAGHWEKQQTLAVPTILLEAVVQKLEQSLLCSQS